MNITQFHLSKSIKYLDYRLLDYWKWISAAFCVSYVPEQGSVGASGDLCPLAHLALGMLGEGKMWSPSTGWDDASIVLEKNNLEVCIIMQICYAF